MTQAVKISQLVPTGQATTESVFMTVRGGSTVFVPWSDLSASDLIVFARSGETVTTPFSTITDFFEGNTTPNNDQVATGVSLTTLARVSNILDTDQLIVGDTDLSFANNPDPAYTSLTENKIKRIDFALVNALLSPDIIDPPTVVLYNNSYANDAGAPVLDCELYRIDQGNQYGFVSPDGALLIRKLGVACTTTYASNAAAMDAGLSPGDIYNVSLDNHYGINHAGGRGIAVVVDVNGQTPTFKGPFASHAEAEAAGVVQFEAYIAAANHQWGFVGGGHALVVRTQ